MLLPLTGHPSYGLPTPHEWEGIPLGSAPIRPDRAAQYVEMLAERSPRIHVEIIGRTHQHRPLQIVTVSSPERIAQFQSDRELPSQTDETLRIMMMFAIHGDELSTVDAGLLFLHSLATGNDPTIERALDRLIIQVVPVANPDGYARSAQWVTSHSSAVPVADPSHAEHRLGWPRGRFNHYGFDLNRQWLAASQPESQALLAAYLGLGPHLVGDFHEMLIDWPYYFSPGVRGRRNPWIPEGSLEKQHRFAQRLALLLDERGEFYFSGEFFDEFSPAMGSTYPLLDGAIGMLLENRGFAGRKIEGSGGIETLTSRILRHHSVALELVKHAIENAEQLQDAHRLARRDTNTLRRRAGDQGYLVVDHDGGSRLRLLHSMLKRHDIVVEQLQVPIRLEDGSTTPEHSIFIALDQPRYRLIRNLFEPLTEFDDPIFYDGPAWVLPPAFNLQTHIAKVPKSQRTPVEPPAAPEPPAISGAYAWVLDWRHQRAARTLTRILREGADARLLTGRFVLDTDQGTREYPSGIVVVPAHDGQALASETTGKLLATLAAEEGVEIRTVAGGQSRNERFLGGINVTTARLPQVLLAWGPTVNTIEAGELWHLLDREIQVATSLRDPREFEGIEFARYTHIILPDGDYETLGADLARRLDAWVRAGGILVGVRRGARWAVDAGLTEAAQSRVPADPESDGAPERADYADKERIEALARTPGAILQSDVDITHPLGAGLTARTLPLYRSGTLTLPLGASAFATVAAWTDALPIAGRLAEAQSDVLLPGTPAMLAERRGAGSVVLFSDNPDHRGYWHGSHRLIFNVLYFGRSFLPPGQRFAE